LQISSAKVAKEMGLWYFF